ncbi:hypothetical protein F3K43_04605 [Streptomyces sp. LBUM 1476]|nr:hypothetical protein [Streptomyces sp. LBUM 1476]
MLFARAHSDSAAPRDIPVADLLTALDVPVPPGEEHPVTSEIRQALAAAHQSDNPFSTPLGQIVTAVADRYNGMLSWYGTSLLHEHGPEGPAPSPLDHAARRLASHLNSYRPQGPIPPAVPAVDDGPLRIEAFQVYLVTRDNLPLLMCTDCGRPLHALAVDGFMVTAECGSQRQHLRDVEAAHVRLALARATGVAPSVQGQHTVADLYIASAAMPREADPRRYNAVLWNQFRGALRAR